MGSNVVAIRTNPAQSSIVHAHPIKVRKGWDYTSQHTVMGKLMKGVQHPESVKIFDNLGLAILFLMGQAGDRGLTVDEVMGLLAYPNTPSTQLRQSTKVVMKGFHARGIITSELKKQPEADREQYYFMVNKAVPYVPMLRSDLPKFAMQVSFDLKSPTLASPPSSSQKLSVSRLLDVEEIHIDPMAKEVVIEVIPKKSLTTSLLASGTITLNDLKVLHQELGELFS